MQLGMCNTGPHGINIDGRKYGFNRPDPGIRTPSKFPHGDFKQRLKELFDEIPLNNPIKFLDEKNLIPHEFHSYMHDYRYFIYNHAYLKIDAANRKVLHYTMTTGDWLVGHLETMMQ